MQRSASSRQPSDRRVSLVRPSNVSVALALVLAALLLVACGTSRDLDGPTCNEDADCSNGLICVDGECTEATGDAVDDATTTCDVACGAGESCCAGRCVDIANDTDHCGACGVECGANETCEAGVCACGSDVSDGGPACAAPLVCCGDGADAACADTLNDDANCGACGIACSAEQVCIFGGCQCPAGQDRCEADGGCVDILNNPAHCGGCGVDCGDQACTAGRCVCGVVSCGEGEACCSIDDAGDTRFACVDEASFPDNPNHCGGCAGAAGQKCPPNTVCEGGECICGATGAACQAGEVCCDAMECTPEAECLCGGSPCSQVCCDSTCTDTDTDSANCGACGNSCGAGQECLAGECVCTETDLALCDGTCVDVISNVDHCGACGNACAAGEQCCSGSCTDTEESSLHCGTCGNACGAGEVCAVGRCVPPTAVVQVAAGPAFTCARRANHELLCWGRADGGRNALDGMHAETPTVVAGIRAVDICAGGPYGCAVDPAGQLYCWGENADGELGLGDKDVRLTPVPVGTSAPVVGIGCGRRTTCAVLDDGSAQCWGRNNYGQVGDGTLDDTQTPRAVLSIADVVDVEPARRHTCAVTGSGGWWCWGSTNDERVPCGTSNPADPCAIALQGGPVIVDIATGQKQSYAVDADNRLWGAGNDDSSLMLGAQRAGELIRTEPTIAIESNEDERTVCFLDDVGAPHCWGRGNNGEIGNGEQNDAATPTPVQGLPAPTTDAAVDLSVGNDHVCVVMASGGVYCWGRDDAGALGNGPEDGDSTTATPVVGLP